MKNFGFGLEGFGIIGAIAGLCYLGYQCYKLHQTAKKLDTTIEDLSKKDSIDIQQDIVQAAVEGAVDRRVRQEVANVSARVGDQIRHDMDKEIRKEVQARYEEIKATTGERVKEIVTRIDESSFRKEVREAAKKELVQKFSGDLDDYKNEYTRSVGAVTGIYEGIANKVVNSFMNNVGGNSGGGKGIKLMLD